MPVTTSREEGFNYYLSGAFTKNTITGLWERHEDRHKFLFDTEAPKDTFMVQRLIGSHWFLVYARHFDRADWREACRHVLHTLTDYKLGLRGK